MKLNLSKEWFEKRIKLEGDSEIGAGNPNFPLDNYPVFLYRNCDGERFTKQPNGRYSMDSSVMKPKYEYSYSKLISDGFVDSLDKCNIIPYIDSNDGHGNEDDESC